MTRRAVPYGLATPADTTPRSGRELWWACCAGREPAESLDPRDREDLLVALAARGWSVRQIAVHTWTTEYTVARILARAGHTAVEPPAPVGVAA